MSNQENKNTFNESTLNESTLNESVINQRILTNSRADSSIIDFRCDALNPNTDKELKYQKQLFKICLLHLKNRDDLHIAATNAKNILEKGVERGYVKKKAFDALNHKINIA